MSQDSQHPQPIFILGIMPRCGTNFLTNLLLLHRDCTAPAVVWEDYALAHIDLLANYSEHVSSHWESNWGVTKKTRLQFDTALGQGICAFLSRDCENKQVIAKTPDVKNLDSFFRFFPHARLIILLRDGRAIVESGMRSFGWNREAALHWLAGAARSVVNFRQKFPQHESQYRIVTYEQLWLQPEETLRELLAFLDLDSSRYDFSKAKKLPLRGSSELVGGKTDVLHWDPVERNQQFNPLSRHEHWSAFMHYRYQQVAGEAMEALGYTHTGPVRLSWTHWVGHQLLNLAWRAKSILRPLYKRLLNRQSSAT